MTITIAISKLTDDGDVCHCHLCCGGVVAGDTRGVRGGVAKVVPLHRREVLREEEFFKQVIYTRKSKDGARADGLVC